MTGRVWSRQRQSARFDEGALRFHFLHYRISMNRLPRAIDRLRQRARLCLPGHRIENALLQRPRIGIPMSHIDR